MKGLNNLYGLGMSQYLPYGRFKWLSNKIIDKSDVKSIAKIDLMVTF